jgi:hypothetical protein
LTAWSLRRQGAVHTVRKTCREEHSYARSGCKQPPAAGRDRTFCKTSPYPNFQFGNSRTSSRAPPAEILQCIEIKIYGWQIISHFEGIATPSQSLLMWHAAGCCRFWVPRFPFAVFPQELQRETGNPKRETVFCGHGEIFFGILKCSYANLMHSGGRYIVMR